MPTAPQRANSESSDWETDSWPVARAHDLIDRIEDLCAYPDDQSPFQIQYEGYHILCAISDMLNDLKAQLMLTEADLCPCHTDNKLATRWRLFEAHEILREAKNIAKLAHHIHKQALTTMATDDSLPLPDNAPVIDCAALFARIASCMERLRDLIKLVAG